MNHHVGAKGATIVGRSRAARDFHDLNGASIAKLMLRSRYRIAGKPVRMSSISCALLSLVCSRCES